MTNISETDRQIASASLVEIAESLRKKYGLTVCEARRQLKQILDISI